MSVCNLLQFFNRYAVNGLLVYDIKRYDKFSKILHIETTSNGISFFKLFREVVHRDGSTSYEMASVKKNICSLSFLTENLKASNIRYLEFISAFDNKEVGRERLEKSCHRKVRIIETTKALTYLAKMT